MIKCIVCQNVIQDGNYTPGSNVCHNCTDLILIEKKTKSNKTKSAKSKRRKDVHRTN